MVFKNIPNKILSEKEEEEEEEWEKKQQPRCISSHAKGFLFNNFDHKFKWIFIKTERDKISNDSL